MTVCLLNKSHAYYYLIYLPVLLLFSPSDYMERNITYLRHKLETKKYDYDKEFRFIKQKSSTTFCFIAILIYLKKQDGYLKMFHNIYLTVCSESSFILTLLTLQSQIICITIKQIVFFFSCSKVK